VGTSSGQGNLCAGPITTTQSTCANIPSTGGTIYVQLWTHANGTWMGPKQYTYTASSDPRAQLTSPANNSVLSGSSVTFVWGAQAGCTAYWLDVGSTSGKGDIFGGQISCGTTSQTVSGIPTDNRPIYVQLWTQISPSNWQTPRRYTLTAFNDRGRISFPVPGSQISASTTFCWTPATPAADYWLDVGTVQGQGNISGGVVTGTCQTVTIPAGKGTIYVQLWTRIPPSTGSWLSPIQYTYQGP